MAEDNEPGFIKKSWTWICNKIGIIPDATNEIIGHPINKALYGEDVAKLTDESIAEFREGHLIKAQEKNWDARLAAGKTIIDGVMGR